MNWAPFRRGVGEHLRKARLRARLTQQETAARLPLSLGYYQEVERGVRNPSLQVLFDVSRLLKVRVADLVDVDDSIPAIDLARLDVEPIRTGRKPRLARSRR